MARHSKGHKKPKKKPYGQQRGLFWCLGCDTDIVPSTHKPMKKRARREAKEDIITAYMEVMRPYYKAKKKKIIL